MPVIEIPAIDKRSLPWLENVTVEAALVVPTTWLAKNTLLGVIEAIGTVPPIPERETDWGDPAILSAIKSEAERSPSAEGVKLTCTVQLVPAATVEPQLLVCAKSAALVPAREILEI